MSAFRVGEIIQSYNQYTYFLLSFYDGFFVELKVTIDSSPWQKIAKLSSESLRFVAVSFWHVDFTFHWPISIVWF